MNKKLLLTLTALSFITFSSEAQIWKNADKKIGKKIEDKVNQRAERKIDKAIDKGLDKAEEAPKNNSKSKEADNNNTATETNDAPTSYSMPAIQTGETKVQDKYTFNLGIKYNIKEDISKPKKVQTMTTWYSEKEYFAIDSDKQMFMVMDIANNTIVNFMEEQKMYLAMSNAYSDQNANPSVEVEVTNEPQPNVKIEKIGNETLLGYNCEIYQITTDETTSKVWFTTELKAGYNNFMTAMGKGTKKYRGYNIQGVPNGIMLKMEVTENKNSKTSSFEATEVIKNAKTIVVADYKPMMP